MTPAFVQASVFRRAAFGGNHPLSIGRIGTVYDLCDWLGWSDGAIHNCQAADTATLTRFHASDYVEALRVAESGNLVSIDTRARHNIGTLENPLFPGLFERAATAVGGSILAAQLALEGCMAFHPAGGTHHAQPTRASGFCYFNDPVFAILTMLDAGLSRVLYIDLDAHHGDSVENAFTLDSRVFTISIHEDGRWPGTGRTSDRRTGNARNLAVPEELNDSEFDFLVDEAVLPLARRFDPEAVVIVAGADPLQGDPLSKMRLTNGALWDAVMKVANAAPATVILGGGGYNPWTLGRFWAGLWGKIAGKQIPDTLPDNARVLLTGLSCDLIDDEDIDPNWLITLKDPPNHGIIRSGIVALRDAVLAP